MAGLHFAIELPIELHAYILPVPDVRVPATDELYHGIFDVILYNDMTHPRIETVNNTTLARTSHLTIAAFMLLSIFLITSFPPQTSFTTGYST